MINFGELVNTVQNNCHISDARYAGNYTMCTFLMKMREYYRWENDLPFASNLSNDEVGSWLVEREQAWEQLESRDYEPLPLDGERLDPFDTEGINGALLPLGYVYSSGYGLFSKPHFFLGRLREQESRDGATVLVSSCEYARDLVAPPAMSRDNTIFIRQESVRRFLWERIEEWRWSRQKDAPIGRAVACYGGLTDLDQLLEQMTENETRTMILHESGEVKAGRLLGEQWEQMLWALSGDRAEFVIRAIRDHLADCLLTLPQLLQDGNEASLHFYFSNFTGLRKHLFPQLKQAYQAWLETDNMSPLEQTIREGRTLWLEHGRNALALFEQSGEKAGRAIAGMFPLE